MNYFHQTQYIAEVDKDDNIIQQFEKWDAHKQAVLHRAFTVAIFYENQVVLQHRKHPVFNNVLDATISSHQIYEGDALQDDLTALMKTLEREWYITDTDLDAKPTFEGKIYYKAKDPNSEFTEHEMCRSYSCSLKEMKLPNFEFAYGFSLKDLDDVKDTKNPYYQLLAPWIKTAFKENLL